MRFFKIMPKNIRIAMGTLITIIIIATVGFSYIEDTDLFTALYWTFSTITTLGYGDVVPETSVGRLFSIIIMISGVAVVLYAFTQAMAFWFEGTFSSIIGVRKMQEKIKKLKDHTIICGYGNVGRYVVEHLMDEKVPYVVIEKEPLKIEEMIENDILHIPGDATHSETLERAGIGKARVVISCLTADADSLFVLLEAKEMNKKIRVIARATRLENQKRFKKYGAEKVIMPEEAGAIQMADYTKRIYGKGGRADAG